MTCDRRIAHENTWASRWARRYSIGYQPLLWLRVGIVVLAALVALIANIVVWLTGI
jgi:hypothetical protein